MTAVVFLILSLSAFGCAHGSKQKGDATAVEKSEPISDREDKGGESKSVTPATGPSTAKDGKSEPVASRELIVKGIKLKNTQFDYPITINNKVEQWIDYFVGRGRVHFEKYLERSEYFIPFIEPLLRQNEVPLDLVYLAMIESGFNNHARSWARAVGPWQFIPETGRRYGMEINWWVDERRDVQKSTLGAIRYLKELHGLFNSWELASAAYNAGEFKIIRAIKKYKVHDFWELTRKGNFLKPETKNYVPKIIAAALICKNRTQFGFPATYGRKLPMSDITGNTEVEPEEEGFRSIESVADTEEEDSEEDTPAEWAIESDPEDLKTTQNMSYLRTVHLPHVSRHGELTFSQLVEVEVEGPADLFKIADAAELPYAALRSYNPELLRWMTPPSKKIVKVRMPLSNKDRFLSRYNSGEFNREITLQKYRVGRPELLANIARKYRVKELPLTELNPGIRKGHVPKGRDIVLPIPADSERTYAELDLYDPPERKRRRHRKRSRRSKKAEFRQVSLQERVQARNSSRKSL